MDARIEVGKYTYGHNRIKIAQYRGDAKIIIGKFCSISSCVIYLGGNHRPDWITTYPFGHVNYNSFPVPRRKGLPKTNGDVVIGNDVWIGQGVTIMSGVKIGDGAVIGANTHVVSKVKPYSVVGGNPVEFYYYRFNKEVREKLLKIKWWDWDVAKINENIDILCSNNVNEFLKLN